MRDRGWRVFATARAPEHLEHLTDTVGVESVYLDYTEPESIAAAADHVLEATDGSLNALFNNGAYGQPGAIEDLPTDALRAQFEANVFGWHDLTRRMIAPMRARNAGRIVQCSSAHEGDGRDFNDTFLHQVRRFFKPHHVVQGIIKRSQIRVDLFSQVTR